MRKAVIFDLDGTLLDTIDDLADSMNTILAEEGFPTHHRDKYQIFVGDGMKMLAERVLPPERRTEEMVVHIKERMARAYSKRWKEKTKPYDGIPELLDELDKGCVPMAVFSNKPDIFTKQMTDEYFPGCPFVRVLGAREGIPPKPDPAGALEIIPLLGVGPGQILYLGDTNTDMKTARRAGMIPLGALWGFRDAEELVSAGAQLLLPHPLALLHLI
jgi:phosphoglycolate phosphatase